MVFVISRSNKLYALEGNDYWIKLNFFYQSDFAFKNGNTIPEFIHNFISEHVVRMQFAIQDNNKTIFPITDVFCLAHVSIS